MRDSKPLWQQVLAEGFRTSGDLLRFLQLPAVLADENAEKTFRTRVPLSFAERMRPGDANDPLLRQVLASSLELIDDEAYSNDPLDERSSNPLKGLIHKYHGRVLVTMTGVCAINCRYCFRRHFPYHDNQPNKEDWQAITDYIAQDATITEVILSGGDPLLAKDSVWLNLIKQLNTIPHLKTLRIHTRIPIVLPERIDESFLEVLKLSLLNKVMVVHCNHPQEISPDVVRAFSRLRHAGCWLLNQSVLLKGVNDCSETLALLSHTLFESGVLPYYLHLLDKVAGAAHFDVPDGQARAIYHQLQAQLPGYLLPRLAREEPGHASKTLVNL